MGMCQSPDAILPKWDPQRVLSWNSCGYGKLQRTLSNCACMCAESLESCLTLCNSMDCSLPGSSTHRILQARIWECIVKLSSRGSSPPRDRTCISYISCTGRPVLYHQHHLGSPRNYNPINRKESKTSQLCSVVTRHCMLMRWRSEMEVFVLTLKRSYFRYLLVSPIYTFFCACLFLPMYSPHSVQHPILISHQTCPLSTTRGDIWK